MVHAFTTLELDEFLVVAALTSSGSAGSSNARAPSSTWQCSVPARAQIRSRTGPGTAPDSVGHQLMNGQHHVFDSVVRKAYPAGTGLHVGSQRTERAGIERHVENQCFVSVSCVIHLPCNRPRVSASHSYL